ncbi:MAG: hypothetical protein RLN69_15100 [Woeseiaceae bacterium]
MLAIRTLMLVSVLVLGGCSTFSTDRQDVGYSGSQCRDGSLMICSKDSLRGCDCGILVVL